MKKGNKAIWIIAIALVLYLAVGLLLMPRNGKVKEEVAAPQEESAVKEDSLLSYALGVIISQDVPYAISMLGINESEIDDFVKGMRDAFPVNESPEAVAYARGLVMGATALETLDEAEYGISQSDSTKKINKAKFFEGVEAMATGKNLTMTVKEAWEYYNKVVFCTPSEAFMERNSTRNGVRTLPSGVQVKIERNGEGATPVAENTIGYIYKASFINGNSYDSSRGEVVEAKVATLLPGLIDAVTALPVGTKCKVYLPWQKAYGEKGSDNVPPYSAVIYDIEIVKIVK